MKHKSIKIAFAQLNSTVGNFSDNAAKIIHAINRAKEEKAKIVITPELAVCGYPPEDLIFKAEFLKKNKIYLKKIARSTRGIMAIVGFVNAQKKHLYNAAAIIWDGKIVALYHKIMLPNYSVFDEKRYFSPGTTIPIYLWNNLRFSITICEDIWTGDYCFSQIKKHGPLDFLVNISASPFYRGKVRLKEKILRQRAQFLRCPIYYCNLVGGQDEIVFDGGSMVVSKEGNILHRAQRFQEDFFLFNTEKHKPRLLEKDTITETYQALLLGIQDYLKKNGFKTVVIGISGGIDSAVVAALAVYALGKNRVYGLLMPSKYTSVETLRDAKILCKNLGISYALFPITKILEKYTTIMEKNFSFVKHGLTEQNLQARIRGTMLMAFSNQKNCLVLNTGNKSELSVGYCTLYGDMVGGFGVLKDVYKTTVYELARFINQQHNGRVIPVSIVKRAPSAELKPNQKDADDIPPYSTLDKILKLYIEKNLAFKEIVREGFCKTVVQRVITLVDRNEYKRRQAPPGVKITPMAFGKDRRMPITNQFLDEP